MQYGNFFFNTQILSTLSILFFFIFLQNFFIINSFIDLLHSTSSRTAKTHHTLDTIAEASDRMSCTYYELRVGTKWEERARCVCFFGLLTLPRSSPSAISSPSNDDALLLLMVCLCWCRHVPLHISTPMNEIAKYRWLRGCWPTNCTYVRKV